MKKILIDGRVLTDSSTGVKVYTQALIKSYVNFYGKENVSVLVRKKINDLDVLQVEYNKKAYSIFNFLTFHQYLATLDFDIFHAPGHYNSFLKIKGKYYITTICDLFFLAVPCFYRNSVLINLLGVIKTNFIVKRSLKNSDFIVTISETTQKDILRFYNMHSHVYYCGLNEIQRQGESNILKNNNIRKNDFFLYVGFLYNHKNIDFMIEAFKLAHTNKKLIICGKGTEIKMDINNRIIGLGFVQDADLAVLYENCAAFIFPSLYEGFGIPIIEALQYGAKVFSSNGGALSEFSDKFVQFFNPKDKDALISLLEKVDEIEQNREMAIAYAKNFNWCDNLLKMQMDIQVAMSINTNYHL